MKFKGYILFAIIALMLLINVGAVYAKEGRVITKVSQVNSQLNINYMSTDEDRDFELGRPGYIVAIYYNSADKFSETNLNTFIFNNFNSRGPSAGEADASYMVISGTNTPNPSFDPRGDAFTQSVLTTFGTKDVSFSITKIITTLNKSKTYTWSTTIPEGYDRVGVYFIDHAGFWSTWSSITSMFDLTKTTTDKKFVVITLQNNNTTSESSCVGGKFNGVIDKGEECDTDLFYIRDSPNSDSGKDIQNATCSQLNQENPNFGYVSGNLNCNSDCTTNYDDCKTTSNTNQTEPNPSSSSQAPSKIKLDPVKASGDGYICDNHTCYYTETYMDSTDFIKFTVSGRTGETCYYSNESNNNWENDSSKLSNCTEMKSEFETGQNINYKINIEENVPIRVNLYSDSLPSGYLLVGTPSNYDYYFFMYVDDLQSSTIDLYKINNRKLIEFYGGSLPEWIPGITGGVLDSTSSGDCDAYRIKLKNDLNIISVTDLTNPLDRINRTLDKTIVAKENEFATANSSKFNEYVFSTARLYNMTSEETAQFWAIVAGESTLGQNTTCTNQTVENCKGMAQIEYSIWCNSDKRVAGFTELRSQLNLISITSQTQYNSLCDYISKSRLYNNKYEPSILFGAAIYLNKKGLI